MTDEREWPEPKTEGRATLDSYAQWITYFFPYTDVEAIELGTAVIDAKCHICQGTERLLIPMSADPGEDKYPASGISTERSLFTMEHLHGRRTTA